MKTLDTKLFLDTLCELSDAGEIVSTVISGGSMLPFLSPGRDYAFFTKPALPLKKGDIVLYKRKNGDYVLHRIHHIKDGNFFMLGDNQTAVEGPVKKENIQGVVTYVKRKGKLLYPKDFMWKFYSIFWLRLTPFRRYILKTRAFFKINSRFKEHLND